jgi:hypothetical protein
MAQLSSKKVQVDALATGEDVKVDGSLEFVQEHGGNNSKPSYQEASGAPVENISPLGLEVTWFTTIFLNIGQMIGTGVFSTRTPNPCTFSCVPWVFYLDTTDKIT